MSFLNRKSPSQSSLENNRKTLRSSFSVGSRVILTLQTEENFLEENLEAIVLDDSSQGCGLIIIIQEPLVAQQISRMKAGDKCSISVKNHSLISGKIAWIKQLDNKIIRLGIEY